MYEIKNLLLATKDAALSHHGELRTVLLSSQLQLAAFDLLTIKRSTSVLRAPRTECSHVEVRGDALSAWIEGRRETIRLHEGAAALERLWNEVPGTPAEVIVALARARRADLTVLAPHRRQRLLELLAPSDGPEIVRRSRNSVLLVHCAPRDRYREVLVGIDFSPESYAAARVALALAPGAHFTFVHAWRLHDEALMRECELAPSIIGYYRERARQGAVAQLDTWLAELGPYAGRAVGAVHSGSPVAVINACARRIGADLIAVGRQGWGGLAPHGLGEVARRLGGQAACDVLIGPAVAGLASARAAARRLGAGQLLSA